MQFGTDDARMHLSSVEGYQKVTSTHAQLVSSSTALAIPTNTSEGSKSTSLSETQVKNQQKTISTKEKYDISQLEKDE
jgi:hypothetical protein